MSWIPGVFPNLNAANHTVESPWDDQYNCIAYAAGDTANWWQHFPGYRWPARRSPYIDSLVEVFEALGFEMCNDDQLEAGYVKVALYAKNGLWKHAARQLPDGRWASKLGEEEDICHSTADGVCGNLYGAVHCYMRKPLATP